MSEFRGLPTELFTFYEGLEQDNSKAYWEANKATWESKVQAPVMALRDELEKEFGQLRTFRPNRDVRFSPDKTPYKTWSGIASSDRAVGGIGYFVRIEASGIRVAGGAMLMARDQIERFRVAIDHPVHGPEFEDLVKQLGGKSLTVTSGRESPLTRVPAGYAKDHPRGEYLRWKGAVVIREYQKAAWLRSRKAIDRIREVWRGAEPLTTWIEKNVGASQELSSRRGR
jgi:uncharacterized protein (TIGR02453 family)